ncbi:hypothetical protein BZA70DRAFT_13518 [Myxozyma melibiosi]|uniref:Thioesterase n=1 Tax=Myxozyma melibiosi TaxID=54550 RepID=A0ABR1FE20_9ASCO
MAWSVSTIFTAVTAVFWLLNAKNFPFAWHIRFYKSLTYFLYIHKPRPEVAGDVFRKSIYTNRSPAMECDLNGHKSNSTYFSDLDIARTDLMVEVFRKLLLDVKKNDGIWLYIPVGAVATVFKREIKPYIKYQISSRVLGWNDKWLFVLSRFEDPKTKKLYAFSLTKYVLKKGRITVPIPEALKASDLWSEEVERKGREGLKYAQGLLDLDMLEEVEI